MGEYMAEGFTTYHYNSGLIQVCCVTFYNINYKYNYVFQNTAKLMQSLPKVEILATMTFKFVTYRLMVWH